MREGGRVVGLRNLLTFNFKLYWNELELPTCNSFASFAPAMTEGLGLEYICTHQQFAADSPLANLFIAPCLSDSTTARFHVNITCPNVETDLHCP